MSGDILQPPQGLDEYGLQAWRAIAAARPIQSEAEVLALEAAARAWSRWKGLEERISAMTGGNVLAGEVAQGPNNKLEKSALRVAADEAWASFEKIAKEWHFVRPTTEAPVPSTDLFGVPIRKGTGKPGRPPFIPTDADRRRVAMLLACNWKHARIAETIGCSEPTFRRVFADELKVKDVARDRLEAQKLDVTFSEAMNGSIPAMKHLDVLLEKNDARNAAASFAPGADTEPDEKPKRLGAKEQRVMDARSASSMFEKRFQEAKDAGEIKH